MADKRINALTTTSASVGDDYFAIDGATNGTRKLSAFSPTFGGNATVTGTLTANGLLSAAGATTLDGLPTSAVFGGTKRVVAGYSTSSDYGFLASVDNGVGWKDLWLNPSGGSIKAGGQLIQVADPATIALWKDSTPTKAARFQFNTLADNGFSLGVYDGSSWFNAITVAPTTGVVKVPSTSASTTTSSGALVVGNGTSGGLGVGGAIVAGGALHTTGNGTGGPYLASSANFDFASGQARFYGRGANTSTRATLGFYSTYSDGTGGITLQTFDTSGNATFAGGLTTGADTSLVAIYVPGDSALRAAAGKLYLDTRTTDGGDIVLRPRTNAALTLAAATGNATFTGTLTANSTITAANTIKYVNSGVSNGTTVGPFQADIGADGTLGPLQVLIGGSPSATGASRFGYVAAGDVGAWRRFIVGSNTTSGGGQVLIPSTDISTSTSSGALVVSGGVGVAGAINCGGDITAPTTANITGGRFTSVNSNSYIEQSGSDFNYVTASTRPHVFSIGGTTRFQVTTSGIISSLPASAASLTANSTMTFELTSNTSLKIFVRGSDGTTRSTTLTLA